MSGSDLAPMYRQMGFSDVGPDNKPVNFQETYETKRSEHLDEMQHKEDQMRQMFVQRVKEKETELKEAEKQVGRWVVDTENRRRTGGMFSAATACGARLLRYWGGGGLGIQPSRCKRARHQVWQPTSHHSCIRPRIC